MVQLIVRFISKINRSESADLVTVEVRQNIEIGAESISTATGDLGCWST